MHVSGGQGKVLRGRTASTKALRQEALALFEEQNGGQFGWVRKEEHDRR